MKCCNFRVSCVKRHTEWIVDEIRKVLPISLHFSIDLYENWTNQDEKTRKRMIQEARRIYANNPEGFVQALSFGSMVTSFLFTKSVGQVEENSAGVDLGEWTWFFDLLLEAGKRNPQKIIPQISVLLFEKKSRPPHPLILQLHDERVDMLFPGRREQVLQLLSESHDWSVFSEAERKWIECASREAQERISSE